VKIGRPCEVVVRAGAFKLAAIAGVVRIGQHRNAGANSASRCACLPGVGSRIARPLRAAHRWVVGTKGITFNDRGRGLPLAARRLRYALFRRACCGDEGAPIRAFARSREGPGGTGLIDGGGSDCDRTQPARPREISRQSGRPLCPAMRPESKGPVHITAVIRAGRRRSTSIFCRRARCGTDGPRAVRMPPRSMKLPP